MADISPVLGNYGRFDLCFTHGNGVYLYDDKGNEYLDFATGIAVNSLGHGDKKIADIIHQQAQKLTHVSNLYHIDEQEKLAQELTKNVIFDQAFFCNSGLEATEAGVKFARRWAYMNKGQAWLETKGKILCLNRSFHGRGLTSLAAAGNEKYLEGFAPKMNGFCHCDPNDIDDLYAACDENVFAIMVEPVIGEGGILPLSKDFMAGIAAIQQSRDILLIMDEVQSGVGRAGSFWAYQQYDLKPDILCAAKGLGNGFPIGAVLVRHHVGQHITPGTHGSTFGGNPLACAVAHHVVTRINDKKFLNNVKKLGDYFDKALQSLTKSNHSVIAQTRGLGLMRAIKCDDHILALDMVKALHHEGLLTVAAGDNIVRLLPPLVVDKAQIDHAVDKLSNVSKSLA